MENLDSDASLSCTVGTTGNVSQTFDPNQGQYVQRHDPFPFFHTGNLDANDVPTSAWKVFPPDGNSRTNTTWEQNYGWQSFVFITPDIPHDMHPWGTSDTNTQVAQGDGWLANYMPDLIQYANMHNALIVVTMDEGPGNYSPGGSGEQIPVLFISPSVVAPSTINTWYDTTNLTKTIMDNFGGDTTGMGDADAANDMSVPLE